MNGQSNPPYQYFFSIAVLLGLLFAMISTDENISKPWLFLQWQAQSVLPMAMMFLAHVLLVKSKLLINNNAWLTLFSSGLIGATLFVPVALIIDVQLGLETQPFNWQQALLNEWAGVTPPVVLCWLAINAPWVLGLRLFKEDIRRETESVIKDTDTIEQAAFYSMLPKKQRGALIYLKAELHYLKVVTEAGSCLILYNLKNAITELPNELGVQTHRSYWASKNHIMSFKKTGRQGELVLEGDHTVPVSRNKLSAVSKLIQNTN